jgi:20S proteasome alpha/beta subunit
VTSGDIECVHEIASNFGHCMAALKPKALLLERVKKEYQEARTHVLHTACDNALRTSLGITYSQFVSDDTLVPSVRNRAFEIVQDLRVEFEGIVAGFDKNRKPIFFYSTFNSAMEENPSPGYFCIGSGSDLAYDFLSYRLQGVHLSVQQSLLHLVEAKTFAQIDSAVSTGTKLVLLSANNPAIELDGHPRFREWLNPRLQRTETGFMNSDEEKNAFAKAFKFSH